MRLLFITSGPKKLFKLQYGFSLFFYKKRLLIYLNDSWIYERSLTLFISPDPLVKRMLCHVNQDYIELYLSEETSLLSSKTK